MCKRIFLAGATGAVGKRLTPLLLQAGHRVAGATRSPAKAEDLRKSGVQPIVVNVFDRDALRRAVASTRPEIVIHQLTDLPPGLDPGRMGSALQANARVREEGTRNLVEAAQAAGSSRLIAQSIAWAYAPGSPPFSETAPLDVDADGDRGVSVRGVAALEDSVLNAGPVAGLVLRYGRLYGAGTGFDAPPRSLPLHVDAAAYAAFLAIDHGGSGIYNIAEPDTGVRTDKAVAGLGWSPGFRLPESRSNEKRPGGI